MAQFNLPDLSEMEKEATNYKKLETMIKNIQFQLDDIKNTRDPLRANQRIDLLQQQLEQFGVKISDMDLKLESFGKTDKFIEVFSDDEFKLLYQNSGLGAKDVASLIKKNEKFKNIDVSAPAISKIVAGTIGSLELRSYLGKQFRFAITKRANI